MKKEEWVDINDNYKISNLGRIFNKRLKRYSKVSIRKDGYCKTTINYKTVYVHRLVAESFIPNPHNKPQVSHLNGIPTDNKVSNLEWATAKENCKLKEKHGTAQKGEKSGTVKLKNADILEIRRLLSINSCRKTIRDEYKISNSTLSDIKKRKTWKHI